MGTGTEDLIWVDLSTFDLARARRFYGAVLGWEGERDPSGYVTAVADGTPTAGLFVMPEFLQRINMPSFWMSYIAVDDVDATVARARELGATIELEEAGPWGKVGLIRDPAGAGFTVYQGDVLQADRDRHTPGRWRWSELFVSDLSVVEPFYRQLFGWRITPDSHDRHHIDTADGRRVGAIQVASNEEKGDKEFWAVSFTVEDLDAAAGRVVAAGGMVETAHDNADGTHLLAYDDQGAAFFLTAARGGGRAPRARSGSGGGAGRSGAWRVVLGLIAVFVIVLLDQDWAWGVLFLMWVVPDLRSGTTYFMAPVDRWTSPALYWTVMLTWIALSLYLLASVAIS